MCNSNNSKCKHPEKLKGKPGECSQERIRKCHGEQKGHSCKNNKEE
ncbi:hypothetical protein [Selenihalanaerobacter shriftii]|uniref:Uncharacterized protein n=1 Tax=Selenihalanaerobacter shriftii TaxID=142842 RepID=A0A1T4MWA4_9FIRM|nr:hypothetical protein [Selenihalanaerobacter shriftii]SJZ71243.1 hypothetical protein SAMN02745118_01614 [Selenihalanaerobacter shriftii]